MLVNDSLTGDPLITVPLFTDPNTHTRESISSICYEVHGEAKTYFNLITDKCTSVNAYYERAATPNSDFDLNVVTQIGVRAVGIGEDSCTDIEVDLQFCVTKINNVNVATTYSSDGISVKRYQNSRRVRVSVPNCGSTALVMWMLCTRGMISDPTGNASYPLNFIEFAVMRGLNLKKKSHGLIGVYTGPL